MSAGVKVTLAILVGIAASALARFSHGPSPVDTYTAGLIYWLNHYSGFYFALPIAGIVWLIIGSSPKRDSIAANILLSVTVVAAVLAIFGALGK